jgi:hypothetical protein
MAFVSLFTVSKTVFGYDWTIAVKALFLFMTFQMAQSYEQKSIQHFLASKMSIKPKYWSYQILWCK